MSDSIVDVHTHVFNAGYLPIQGILEKKFGVSRWLARRVDGFARRVVSSEPVDCTQSLAAGSLETGDLSLQELIDRQVARVDDGWADDEELGSLILEQSDIVGAPSLDDEALALGLNPFDWAQWVFRRLADAVDNGRALIRWLDLIFSAECDIFQRLTDTMGSDVKLYVHHMMDMDNYYPGRHPKFDFVEDQIPRMLALQSQKEQLVTFVAFDPMRDDGLAVVSDALENGATGVKFYPPNGYKPIGNSSVIDQRNLGLFNFCVDEDVPIFAHCTSAGFEAEPGSGYMSDPLWWRQVLRSSSNMGQLRLGLAHAGGASEWIHPHRLGPFARTVLELCEDFPNVYCEFGHFEEILEDDARARLQTRLAEIIAMEGPGSVASFKDKIMFGSDWHVMAIAEIEADDYLEAFQDVMTGPLAPVRERFFRDNALQFLNRSLP